MHNPTALFVHDNRRFCDGFGLGTGIQNCMRSMFPKRKLLGIYGKRPMFHLVNRIDTRDDKYELQKNMSIDMGLERIIKLASLTMSYYRSNVGKGEKPAYEALLFKEYPQLHSTEDQ